MPAAGDRFGDFVLRRELGRGAMGVVWEAWQESLSRAVALKVLAEGVGQDPLFVARFKAEAGAAARLSHPGLLPVYAVGETAGLHWFAMEKVEGEDLARVLASRGRLPPDEAARHVSAAARALAHAHAHGVVHRDVKPANLMLRRDGRVVVTDFGLSKETTAAGLTTTGMLVGTPYYMSPELVAGDPSKVSARSDLYGLGVTLYELLTGAPPFQADSAMGLIRLIAEAEPTPPSALVPRLPRDLETITLVCLAKDPARRYESADALADDLDRTLAHEPISRRRPGLGERLARFVRRHRTAVAVGAVALAALLVTTLGFRRELSTREQGYRAEIARLLAEADALAEAGEEARAEAIEAALEQRAGGDADFARDHAIETARDLVEDLRAGKALSATHQRKIVAWADQAPARITLEADAQGVTVEGRRLSGAGDARGEAVALAGGPLVPGLWRLRLSAPGRLRTLLTLLAPPGVTSVLRVSLPREEGAQAGLLSYGGAWFPSLDPARAASADAFEALQPPYLLAARRTTAREYAAFLDAAPAADRGRLTPAPWATARPTGAALDAALAGLSFEQAQAFARARGLRLPTDAELMNAVAGARGVALRGGLRGNAAPAAEEGRRRVIEEARLAGQALAHAEGLADWDGSAEWAVAATGDDAGEPHPWPVWTGLLALGAEAPAGRGARLGAPRRGRKDLEAALAGRVHLRLAGPAARP